jgi:hypothetical protein
MTVAIALPEAGDGRCDWCGGIVGELSGCHCRPCVACGGPLEESEELFHSGCSDDVLDSEDPDSFWPSLRRIEDVPVREGLL